MRRAKSGAILITFVLVFLFAAGAGRSTALEAEPEHIGPFESQWTCWDDGSMDPCHRQFVGIQALADDDVWMAVGGNNSAAILQYDGRELQDFPLPPRGIYGFELHGLQMLSAEDGWAVGHDLAWHWDGDTWRRTGMDEEFDNVILSSVDAIVNDDVWAVGWSFDWPDQIGAVARWNGNSWAGEVVDDALFDVSVDSSGVAWAVGNSVLYQMIGDDWTTIPAPVDLDLLAVEALPDRVWMVGADGIVLSYDDGEWAQTPNPFTADLLDISLTPDGQGWIVGRSGTIYRFHDGAMVRKPSPTNADLASVTMVSDNHAYAVSEGGALIHWDGSEWVLLYDEPDRRWLSDIVAVTPNDAWAAGENGRLEHWENNAWQPVQTPVNKTLAGLDFLNKHDGWAVGEDGTILHWTGKFWQLEFSPREEWFNAVDMVAPANGWTVGTDGVILHYDGLSWTEVPSPTDWELYDVQMVNANEGWAVGGGWSFDPEFHYVDTILHWDGLSWDFAVPEDTLGGFFSGLDVRSPDDVFATNIFGLWHWDGEEWDELDDAGVGQPHDVEFVNSVDGWIGSWNGTIAHWDGEDWDVVFNETPDIAAITAYLPFRAWAVTGEGSGGAILQINGTQRAYGRTDDPG